MILYMFLALFFPATSYNVVPFHIFTAGGIFEILAIFTVSNMDHLRQNFSLLLGG